jgi:hypothetical protein
VTSDNLKAFAFKGARWLLPAIAGLNSSIDSCLMGDSAPKLLQCFFSFSIHVYKAANLSAENHHLFAHRPELAGV